MKKIINCPKVPDFGRDEGWHIVSSESKILDDDNPFVGQVAEVKVVLVTEPMKKLIERCYSCKTKRVILKGD